MGLVCRIIYASPWWKRICKGTGSVAGLKYPEYLLIGVLI